MEKITTDPEFNTWYSLFNKSKTNISSAPTRILRKGKSVNIENEKNVQTLYFIIYRLIEEIENLRKMPMVGFNSKRLGDLLNDLVLSTVLRKELNTKNNLNIRIEKLAKTYLHDKDWIFPLISQKGKPISSYLEKVIEKLLEGYLKDFGGFITITTLLKDLMEIMKDTSFSHQDVENALNTLKKARKIHSVTKTNKTMLIEIIPFSLSTDKTTILNLAKIKQGVLKQSNIILELGWIPERIDRALNACVEEKLAILSETFQNGKIWYFPQFYNSMKNKC